MVLEKLQQIKDHMGAMSCVFWILNLVVFACGQEIVSQNEMRINHTSIRESICVRTAHKDLTPHYGPSKSFRYAYNSPGSYFVFYAFLLVLFRFDLSKQVSRDDDTLCYTI
jgi:hypothetical protein